MIFRNGLYLKGYYNVQFGNSTHIEDIAKWSTGQKFNLVPGVDMTPIRTFYRIGVTEVSICHTCIILIMVKFSVC